MAEDDCSFIKEFIKVAQLNSASLDEGDDAEQSVDRDYLKDFFQSRQGSSAPRRNNLWDVDISSSQDSEASRQDVKQAVVRELASALNMLDDAVWLDGSWTLSKLQNSVRDKPEVQKSLRTLQSDAIADFNADSWFASVTQSLFFKYASLRIPLEGASEESGIDSATPLVCVLVHDNVYPECGTYRLFVPRGLSLTQLHRIACSRECQQQVARGMVQVGPPHLSPANSVLNVVLSDLPNSGVPPRVLADCCNQFVEVELCNSMPTPSKRGRFLKSVSQLVARHRRVGLTVSKCPDWKIPATGISICFCYTAHDGSFGEEYLGYLEEFESQLVDLGINARLVVERASSVDALFSALESRGDANFSLFVMNCGVLSGSHTLTRTRQLVASLMAPGSLFLNIGAESGQLISYLTEEPPVCFAVGGTRASSRTEVAAFLLGFLRSFRWESARGSVDLGLCFRDGLRHAQSSICLQASHLMTFGSGPFLIENGEDIRKYATRVQTEPHGMTLSENEDLDEDVPVPIPLCTLSAIDLLNSGPGFSTRFDATNFNIAYNVSISLQSVHQNLWIAYKRGEVTTNGVFDDQARWLRVYATQTSGFSLQASNSRFLSFNNRGTAVLVETTQEAAIFEQEDDVDPSIVRFRSRNSITNRSCFLNVDGDQVAARSEFSDPYGDFFRITLLN